MMMTMMFKALSTAVFPSRPLQAHMTQPNMLAAGQYHHMVITKNIPIKEWLKQKEMWGNNEGEAEKLQKDVDESYKTTLLKTM